MNEEVQSTKKEKFIEAFWEAVDNGVPEKMALTLAKQEAGYSENTKMAHILKSIDEELVSHASMELKLTLPRAVRGLKSVLEDPEQKGAANAIAASNSILDRTGIVKKEAKDVNITMPSGLAFMPTKKPVSLTDEDSVFIVAQE